MMEVTQFAEQVRGEDVVSKLKSIYDDALARQSPVINITSDPHLLGSDCIRNIIESGDIQVAVITRSTRDKDLTFFLEFYTDYFHIQRKDFRIKFPCQRNPKWTEEVYTSPYFTMYLYPHSNILPTEKHEGYFISNLEIVERCYNLAVHVLKPLVEHEQLFVEKVHKLDDSIGAMCEALARGELIDPKTFLD